jgi:hypothetical protein
MVTIYKLRETEMGYRGSKSGISLVKEQRVDGSWFGYNPNLRYTLIETKLCFYLTFFLTKLYKIQVNKLQIEKKRIQARLYSTSSAIINNLNSLFITGLIYGEGSSKCIKRKLY